MTATGWIVECRREGDHEVPVRFGVPPTWRVVAEVVDRWPGEGYCYFRVRTVEGAAFTLRRDDATGTWSLHSFELAGPARGDGDAR
jgi:hypothetical protein